MGSYGIRGIRSAIRSAKRVALLGLPQPVTVERGGATLRQSAGAQTITTREVGSTRGGEGSSGR